MTIEKLCVGALLAMAGGVVFGMALEAETQLFSAALAVLCAFALSLAFYVLQSGIEDGELESVPR